MFIGLYINTILFGVILCLMIAYVMGIIAMIIPSVLIAVLYCLYIKRWLRVNEASDRKTSPLKQGGLCAMLGGTAGVFVAGILLRDIEQKAAVDILIICMIVFSCLFSYAASKSFIKARLIKKMASISNYTSIEFKTKEALKLLLKKGYIITSLEHNSDAFGDILIVVSGEFFDMRFVLDRQDFICQVMHNGEMYFIDDIFEALEIKFNPVNSDFFDYVTYCAEEYVKNEIKIRNSFSDKNFAQMKSLIKKRCKERVSQMFDV